jgi:putative helicase MOV10L1
VLLSPFAKEYGLELSFLERLSHNLLYERDSVKFVDHGCYDPVLVTKLVRNYR